MNEIDSIICPDCLCPTYYIFVVENEPFSLCSGCGKAYSLAELIAEGKEMKILKQKTKRMARLHEKSKPRELRKRI